MSNGKSFSENFNNDFSSQFNSLKGAFGTGFGAYVNATGYFLGDSKIGTAVSIARSLEASAVNGAINHSGAGDLINNLVSLGVGVGFTVVGGISATSASGIAFGTGLSIVAGTAAQAAWETWGPISGTDFFFERNWTAYDADIGDPSPYRRTDPEYGVVYSGYAGSDTGYATPAERGPGPGMDVQGYQGSGTDLYDTPAEDGPGPGMQPSGYTGIDTDPYDTPAESGPGPGMATQGYTGYGTDPYNTPSEMGPGPGMQLESSVDPFSFSGWLDGVPAGGPTGSGTYGTSPDGSTTGGYQGDNNNNVYGGASTAFGRTGFGSSGVYGGGSYAGSPGFCTIPTEKHAAEWPASWRRHAASRTVISSRSFYVMRYNDKLAHPERTFDMPAVFTGPRPIEAQLRTAIDKSSFAERAKQKSERGFMAKPKHPERCFRKGPAGHRRELLSPEQIRAVLFNHAPMMQRTGYLPLKSGTKLLR